MILLKRLNTHALVLALIVGLSLWGPSAFAETHRPSLAESLLSCIKAIFHLNPAGQRPLRVETELLVPDTKASMKPTVIFLGQDASGNVILEKKSPRSAWYSAHEYMPGTFTKQADPRRPLFTLGFRLYQNLGFSIFELPNRAVRLIAPSAEKLKRKVLEVNEVLKKRGKEPISYLPVQQGFLSARQIIELGSRSEGDIALRFPYDDNNPNLTVHEVAYHLGSILLPRSLLVRAQYVNLRTLQLAAFLDKHQSVLGEQVTRLLTDQLLKERSFEIDAGTANFSSYLSKLKEGDLDTPFSASYKFAVTEDLAALAEAVSFLARPNVYPTEAAVMRVAYMAGLYDGALKLKTHQVLAPIIIESAHGFGTYFNFPIGIRVQLESLLNRFLSEHLPADSREASSLSSAHLMTADIFKKLDKRIDDINEAFDEVRRTEEKK
ncbi:MAG: hypothetical protein IT289_05760 [Oligoflexia bacterium]|nr:hypothetical protein [Oligoflexia bacterium]